MQKQTNGPKHFQTIIKSGLRTSKMLGGFYKTQKIIVKTDRNMS